MLGGGVLEFVDEDVRKARAQAAPGVGHAFVPGKPPGHEARPQHVGQHAHLGEVGREILGEAPGQADEGRKPHGRAQKRQLAQAGGVGRAQGRKQGVELGRDRVAAGLEHAGGEFGFGGEGRTRRRVGLVALAAAAQEGREMGRTLDAGRLHGGQKRARGQGQLAKAALETQAQRLGSGGLAGQRRGEQLAGHGLGPFPEAAQGEKARGVAQKRRGRVGEALGQGRVLWQLRGQAVVEGVEDVGKVEGRLEIRAQAQFQGEDPSQQEQQAVDGADVEALGVDEQVFELVARLAARGGVRASEPQRQGLEPAEHAFAHLGGGLVGEGHGEDLGQGVAGLEAVGAGARQVACGPQGQGNEAFGQGVGLARAGRGLDLDQHGEAPLRRTPRYLRRVRPATVSRTLFWQAFCCGGNAPPCLPGGSAPRSGDKAPGTRARRLPGARRGPGKDGEE